MEPKQIIVRPATPEDAPIIAAALTMALGKETMKLYCGENYQDVLEELVRMENTQYSYRNALVADVNGTPAGAIVGYDGARLHELRRPTLRRIEERTGQTFEGVEDETHPGEYYLDSLGVLPEYRRLGIGGRLLTALRELGPDADGRMPQGSPVPAITCRIRRMHENMQRTRLALEESHENLRQNLRQTEKMALVGKLAAGVAHSIRNPLTGLKLRLFSFTRGMELSPAQQEDVQAMNEAVRHMEAITSNFLEFSRRPRLSKEPLDMSEVLDRTLILLQPRMEAYKVTLRRTRHAPLPRVDGDAEQLREALANLIINACEAAGTDGEVRISEERGRLAPLGPVVVIRIEDSGPGVPEELHEVIFQPFMSTKVEGTGLGLPIARRIFEEHGGWLHLHNAPGHGASFVMVLPVRKGDDVWLRSS